ncbi:zinc finger protein 135 [Folsomia candida]|uniref:zinc finger protein 135 n=1 Tax=Folsomia candida TaxID=158441 RepID=UPI000B8FC02E|nr:zinc finger protein 135 [Folsomia candida]
MGSRQVKRLKCPKCSKLITTNKRFEKHLRMHVTAKCDICVQTFANSGGLRQHVGRFHSGRPKHRYKICLREFKRARDLLGHMANIHDTSERPRHPCTFPGCGKTYQNIGSKIRHVKIQHSQNPVRFSCTLCGHKAKCRGELDRHVRTHTTERPYSCRTCGARKAQISDLRTHERTHQNITTRQKFPCRLCSSIFMSRTGLLGHIKTYHENYEYPCIQCGKVFMSISGLTTHKMTKHSLNKEPLYSCGKCEFKGWLKGDLTRHLTRVHGGLKTKECYFCDKKYYSFYLLVQHCRRHTLECEV